MRRLLMLLLAPVLTGGALLGLTAGTADAASPTSTLTHVAGELHCSLSDEVIIAGPAYVGGAYHCAADGGLFLAWYRNPAKALKAYRSVYAGYQGPGRYFAARAGHVLLFTADDTRSEARWAARKVHGRVVVIDAR